MSELLHRPTLARLNPHRCRLVRIASPLTVNLNPFENDWVKITPAILYNSTFNSKVPVAYELIVEAIRSGKIDQATKVIAASSGNTGLGIAQICKSLGIECHIVMQNDTPQPKVGIISALGSPINTILVSSGTVKYANERGNERGWYNVDQYTDTANLEAQFKYFAPQLWLAHGGRIDLIVVPGGTLGTAGGLKKFVEDNEFSTKIVVALCADGQEVPGARDEMRIRRDVKIASLDDFEYRMTATRYQSFLASYAMFSEIEWTPGGPTSGLALSVALRFLRKRKEAKTLDQFRGPDGAINVVFLCPDDYRLYGDLYRSTLNENRDFFSSSIPVSRLLEDA